MKLVRQVTRTGIAGLTAVALVIGGGPLFECRCPNGRLKPLCLGLPSGPSGCCCGGSCCAGAGSDAVKQEKAACCCCRHARAPKTRAPGKTGQAGRPACHKTPVAVTVLACGPDRAAVGKDVTAGALAFCMTARALPPAEGPARPDWHVHLVGPPTDLVVLLRHFLI